jgi:hypothetical protein
MNLTDTVYNRTSELSHSTTDSFSRNFLNKSPSYLRTIKAQGRELNSKSLATLLNNVCETTAYHARSAESIPQLQIYSDSWKQWEDDLAGVVTKTLVERLSLTEGAKKLVRKHLATHLS